MHTDVSAEQLGQGVAQRYRKIWSTLYVLDRELTSWHGLPQSINDKDIQLPLAYFPDSPQLSKILQIRVKFSRVIAQVNRGIHLQNSFLSFDTRLTLVKISTKMTGLWIKPFWRARSTRFLLLQSSPTKSSKAFLSPLAKQRVEFLDRRHIFIYCIIRYVLSL